MAFDPKNYVPWWRQFSEYVRFERAKNRCECSGECGKSHDGRCAAGNKQFLIIYADGQRVFVDVVPEVLGMPKEIKSISRICLTVAHLDNDGGICKCKKEYGFKCGIASHVLAMCNGCHLRLDHAHHIQKAKDGRQAKKDEARRLFAQV